MRLHWRVWRGVSVLLLHCALCFPSLDAFDANTEGRFGTHREDVVDAMGSKIQRHILQKNPPDRNEPYLTPGADEVIQPLSDNPATWPGGRPPAWHGRYDPMYMRSYFAPAMVANKCVGKAGRQCWAIPGLAYPYEEYILDPTDSTNPQPVMKVHLPAGAWRAGASRPGGTLLYAYPFKYHPSNDLSNPISRKKAFLEYEVYFPRDFLWVKGGKLPGLSGGRNNGRGCGGGVSASECFSTRLMWRQDGSGEAYLYLPRNLQEKDFCTRLPKCSGVKKRNCIQCNPTSGTSWGRGSFIFQRGEWNKIRIIIGLNDANQTNGLLEVWHNNRRAISYDKINWRQTEDVAIEGVEIAVFYGGQSADWAPPSNQHLLFRNFKVWRMDSPQRTARPQNANLWGAQQVLVEEEVHEGI